MPHAVIEEASECPELAGEILSRKGRHIHKVLETWTHAGGWVLKSLILDRGEQTKLLVRVDRREDGLLVHLEDHLHVERTSEVFDHLALVAARVLNANPQARLGKTNLEDRIEQARAQEDAPEA